MALRGTVNRYLAHGLARGLLMVALSLPALALVVGAFQNSLGANPAETLIRSTGDWALRFLCATLAVTPLRVQFGLSGLARWRRILGVSVYVYAVLHLLCYAWFDMGFELADMVKDVGKRPFILVGFLAWVLLTPLAATSWNAAIRWMGARRWQLLHRLVYGIAFLAVLHFFWMRAGKHRFGEVLVYAVILAALLLWRVHRAWRDRRSSHADRAAVR